MAEAWVGVDVGGTFAKVAAISQGRKLLALAQLPTQAEQGPSAFMRRLKDFLGAWRREGLKARGLGLGLAGDVDSRRGVLRLAPNLKPWEGFDFKGEARRRLGLAALVDNDANMAVWGGYVLELKSRPQNVLGVTLGTGVGGGLVLEGRLYRGATGSAGELGHTLVETPGRPCHCGNRGCLEAYAGSYGIRRTAIELLREKPGEGAILRRLCPDPESLEPACLSRAAARGDGLAREAWARTGRTLGVGLANLVLVLNPEVVLILGGVSRARRWLAGPMRRVFAAQGMETAFARLRLIFAAQPQAGSIGAALLALQERLDARGP